jgi:UDP-galactopyranose mutase
MTVLIVGAGLTGCTVAHRLAQHGMRVVVHERAAVPGGLIRSDHLHGVLHEPHGSHIFHTDDDEVWRLANEMTPFNDYRHRVSILIEGRLLNWPILVSDLGRQSRGDEIRAELDSRRGVDPDARASASNFEEWCTALMGPILYERYVRPYTIKQWGRAPRELAAEWAPRRIGIRWDDDPYLFRDRHQGWPAGPNGYTDLIDGLLDDDAITLRVGSELSLSTVAAVMAEEKADAVVLTCPLDAFCEQCLGALHWRGILVRAIHVPHVELAQETMVVNYPGLEYPFIRVHETKHASRQRCAGTVLGFEFTGAPTRCYPVELPETRRLNEAYISLVRDRLDARRAWFAGRLASYRYLDTDECMRRALDCADEIIASSSSAGGPRGGRSRSSRLAPGPSA